MVAMDGEVVVNSWMVKMVDYGGDGWWIFFARASRGVARRLAD